MKSKLLSLVLLAFASVAFAVDPAPAIQPFTPTPATVTLAYDASGHAVLYFELGTGPSGWWIWGRANFSSLPSTGRAPCAASTRRSKGLPAPMD